ncbi:MAG: ATPase domain-containing protein [Anaeromyxobacteraceae bacterium]
MHDPALLERLTTGVPGLDTVLLGGLYRGSGTLVAGASGSGKTVLGAQIAFAHAAGGGRAGVLTLLTESHERLVSYLSTLSFFDPGAVSDNVYVVSGAARLASDRAQGVLDLARTLIRERRLTMLVVDGVGALEEAATTVELRRIAQALLAFLPATGCTGLLLVGTPSVLEVLGACDVHLHLDASPFGPRLVRGIEVSKLRGGAFLEGRHTLVIDGDGVKVFPRLEAVATRTAGAPPRETHRARTGVTVLDAMLGGGLVAGSSTALLGAPGTGKTLLGMTFLAAGAKAGEPGLYAGFYESTERLVAKCEAVGLPIARRVREGRLHLDWAPPMERLLDETAQRLLETVDRGGVRRVVVDGIDALRLCAEQPGRIPAFLAALTLELRRRDVTTVLTEETDLFAPQLTAPLAEQVLSAVVENIVVLRYVELHARLHRLLAVVKTHEGQHDASLRELTIGPEGLAVKSAFRGAEHLLTGVPVEAAPLARPRGRRR